MDETKSAIIKTLSFFDLFSYPLTKEEVFYYLWQNKADLQSIEKALAELMAENKIKQKDAYYFLVGREDICQARQNRLLESEKKLKIARKATKKISFVPFIKAIFVCNSTAFGFADKNSDIDLFLVTTKKRIWMVRFLTNFVLLFFGLRRINRKSISNKVCLSFYIDEENLNLKNISVVPEDIYLGFWLATLLPIYDPDKIGQKMVSANTWVKNLLPNLSDKLSPYIKEVKNGPLKRNLKKILQKMWVGGYGDLMEKQAKEAQLTKMKFSPQDFQNKAPGVIVSDSMLKFHENDRRREYWEKWKSRYSDIKY